MMQLVDTNSAFLLLLIHIKSQVHVVLCTFLCAYRDKRSNFSAEGYLPTPGTVDNFTKLKIYKKEFLLLLYKNMLCAMCVYSRVLCMCSMYIYVCILCVP